MKWYKRKSAMRHDPKVRRLIRKYGAEGWTVYTVAVDSIAEGLESDSQIIPILQETAEDIGLDYGIDSRKVEEIMQYCGSEGLLDLDSSGNVFCFKIYKYVDEYFTKSQKNREHCAERNRKVISAYKMQGRPGAISVLLELLPQSKPLLSPFEAAFSATPDQLQSNSRVTPELLPSSSSATPAQLRQEEIRQDHTTEIIRNPPNPPFAEDPFAEYANQSSDGQRWVEQIKGES